MIYLRQFSARPWAVALLHYCSCRVGKVPTQYLNVKCGLTVSREHSRNISNVVCMPRYHPQLNYINYSIKHVTPLFRKQKLSCLQHYFKLSSTSIMLCTPDSDYRINGVTLFPSVRKLLEDLNIIPSSYQPGQHSSLMCPKCDGGSRRDRSLSLYIGADGSRVIWNCHRAKCGWKGCKKITFSMDSSSISSVKETKESESTLHVDFPSIEDDTVNMKQPGHPKRSIAFDSPSIKGNEPTVQDTRKPKQMMNIDRPTCTIIDICEGSHTNVFEGDVLSLYGPGCRRDPSSPTKAQLIYADLVDRHGQLTITVSFKNNLIPRFVSKFTVGSSVRITDFDVKQKTIYERGDSEFFLQLTANSAVETIPLVCHCRRLVPNITIHGLLSSRNPYSVGSVAAIVTRCGQTKRQFELDIKDGDRRDDSSVLQLNESFKSVFCEAQQQLASGSIPMYLFKNIVRNGPKGSHRLRCGMSTYIDTLNDECAKEQLQPLAQSSLQVQGVLRAKSAYAFPFAPFCCKCHQQILATCLPSTSSCYCTNCDQDTEFLFEHNLHCMLEKEDLEMGCTLREPLLKQIFPELAAISYQQYKEDISLTLRLLRTFERKGSFTMRMDNVITDIQLES